MGDLVLMGSFAYIAVVLYFAIDRLGRFLDEGGSSPGGGAGGGTGCAVGEDGA